MHSDTSAGYEKVQDLLRYGATTAFGADDQTLGHGIIDLCRTSRKEILAVGLSDGSTEIPRESHEGLLLYRLMPEMARRLMKRDGADLLLIKGERPGADVTNIPDDRLRRYVGMCLSKGAFPLISEKIRDKLDPEFLNEGRFFAVEAVQQDVRSGNIVEIALNRIAPAPTEKLDGDIIASRINDWSVQSGVSSEVSTWNPDLPSYRIDALEEEISAEDVMVM